MSNKNTCTAITLLFCVTFLIKMGKKDKSKKKGKGAEKTQAKTDKKLSNKLKKELKDLGEVSLVHSTYTHYKVQLF